LVYVVVENEYWSWNQESTWKQEWRYSMYCRALAKYAKYTAHVSTYQVKSWENHGSILFVDVYSLLVIQCVYRDSDIGLPFNSVDCVVLFVIVVVWVLLLWNGYSRLLALMTETSDIENLNNRWECFTFTGKIVSLSQARIFHFLFHVKMFHFHFHVKMFHFHIW
jgi:hypothetical protein